MEDVLKALHSKTVDGILVDSYVSDSRRSLFQDLSIKQVIDLKSTYGVVMGTDASKLRKCINKYWRNNAAKRTKFINENSRPVEVNSIQSRHVLAFCYC